MIIVSKSDFETYGMKATSSTISFMGKTFIRSQTFAKRFRRMAIAIAQRNIEKGVPSFIVAFETHFTVWKEKQAECSFNQPFTLAPKASPPLPDSPKTPKTHQRYPKALPQLSQNSTGQTSQHSQSVHSLPTMKYRGHHITLQASDSESIAPPKHEKAKLRYRGNSLPQDTPLETEEWTMLNGQHSSAQPVKQPLSKRLMQYRGQWVHPESL